MKGAVVAGADATVDDNAGSAAETDAPVGARVETAVVSVVEAGAAFGDGAGAAVDAGGSAVEVGAAARPLMFLVGHDVS